MTSEELNDPSPDDREASIGVRFDATIRAPTPLSLSERELRAGQIPLLLPASPLVTAAPVAHPDELVERGVKAALAVVGDFDLPAA